MEVAVPAELIEQHLCWLWGYLAATSDSIPTSLLSLSSVFLSGVQRRRKPALAWPVVGFWLCPPNILGGLSGMSLEPHL